MVQNLPDDSALSRAVNGWTTTQYMLADLIDSHHFGRWEYSQSCGGENPQPDPIPRPGRENEKQERQKEIRAAHDRIMARLKGAE